MTQFTARPPTRLVSKASSPVRASYLGSGAIALLEEEVIESVRFVLERSTIKVPDAGR